MTLPAQRLNAHAPMPSVMARLKEETRSLHARVEESVDLLGRCSTLSGYRGLLERMLGLYLPLEAALGRLDWREAGIQLDERSKVGLLRADLTALSSIPPGDSAETFVRPESPPPVTLTIPNFRTLSSGFGCLYVLEGATLGGQFIVRHVGRSLGVRPGNGASFFGSYGPRVGAMWQAFGQAATAFCTSSERIDEAVSAALSTFQTFDAWMKSTPSQQSVSHPADFTS